MEKNDGINLNKRDINFHCLLNKINHKPIIMSSIYSFTQNRPFILLHLISNDIELKSSLKNTLDKTNKINDLSSELNNNLNNYIIYRKIKENIEFKLTQNKFQNFQFNPNLNSLIQKHNSINDKNIYEKELTFIQDYSSLIDNDKVITNFIDKQYLLKRKKILELYYLSYANSDLNQKNLYFKIKKKYIKDKDYLLNNYEYLMNKINASFFNKKIEVQIKLQKNIEDLILKGKNKDIFKIITYYDYVFSPNSIIISYFTNVLDNKEKKLIFLDNFFHYLLIDKYSINNKDLNEILKYGFDKYPYTTREYHNLIQKEIKNKFKKDGYNLYIENRNQSIITEILKDYYFKNYYDQQKLISLCFDCLSTLDNLYFYNLPKEENTINNNINNIDMSNNNYLDEEYLNYIENSSLKQKICLICLIDRYKYCNNTNNIINHNIYKLHFTLFSNSSFDELFMFKDIPIKDIYKIFITYFLSIKNYKNIEEVSFGDEFFLNKNQFFTYNNKYYQSIISYLIDQYLINSLHLNNKEKSILEDIKTKRIELKEDKLDNIYEQYKIIYGFNKLFPNLESKKILELFYINDIINNDINNKNNHKYKIIMINFEKSLINKDINIIFENVYNYCLNNLKNNLNNIEIMVFINLNISIMNGGKIYKNINLKNKFDILPNLKEFCINNSNINERDNNILNGLNELKIFNKFEHIYIGYDSEDNLIFYRNGKNMIKSIDLLDLFNIFNNKLVKLRLKLEKIDILFNSDKSILKISNLNNINNDSNNNNNNEINFYNYPLRYLSDFIKNTNTINELIIEGFDFIFEEIQNNNVKKLNINFNDYNKLINYNLDTFNNNNCMIEEDVNLTQKFPKLEEIKIGNIENEKFVFNKLFQINNFSNNIKSINIITYHNFKFWEKDIKIEIISRNTSKENINFKKELDYESNEENEEEEEDEENDNNNDDNDDLFLNKYLDIIDEDNPIVSKGFNKKRKQKNDRKN